MSTVLPNNPAKELAKWSTVAGVVMIVAGVLAIALPIVAGIAVNMLIAWLLALCGIAHLIHGWHHRAEGALPFQCALFLLYGGIGGYLLFRPAVGLAALTLALALFLLVEAFVELGSFFKFRNSHRAAWMAVNGVITLVLAIMIWASWPASSEWAIGILLGFSMLFSGISRVAISTAALKLIDEPRT